MTDHGWTLIKPCPICGKSDRCKEPPTKGVVTCFRANGVAPPGWRVIKVNGEATTLAPDIGLAFGRPGQSGAVRGPVYYDKMAAGYVAALDDERGGDLAARWGVTRRSLEEIGVGWWEELGCWTYGEVDDKANIIGLVKRARLKYPGVGKAVAVANHKRGITVPRSIASMPDPVLIVEGASDVAAAYTLGIAAIGRMNNKHGAEYISKWPGLRDRMVIVIGEWDQKTDGTWPGKDGAEHVAKQLAAAWQLPVKWAMTAGGGAAKDLRVWLQQSGAKPDDHDACVAAGRRFVELLKGECNEVDIAPNLTTTGPRMILSNITESGRLRHYQTIEQIHGALSTATDRWPRLVAGELFTLKRPTPPGELPDEGQVWKINSTDDLFAWMSKHINVRWATKDANDPATNAALTPIRKNEFFAYLQAEAGPHYQSIETAPHQPPVDRAFYIPCELPTSDGSALAELMEHFNAASELDRMLMVSAAITPGWGGPCGQRPAFLFTTDHGQGVGKSTTADIICQLWGGSVTVDETEEWEKIRARLLDEGSLAKRCVLVDNVTRKLSRGGLPAAITSTTIDGKKMYVGQASRPNRLSWFITANVPSLSRDLTSRCIPIKVGPAKHRPDFQEWKEHFLKYRRAAFIADVLAILGSESKSTIEREDHDRWSMWQDAVLSKLVSGADLAKHIKLGRPAIDADNEEAENVYELICDIVRGAGHDPEMGRFSISMSELATAISDHGMRRRDSSTRQTSNWLRAIRSGPLLRLTEDPNRASGRRWMWTGTTGSMFPCVQVSYAGRQRAATPPPASKPPEDNIPF